MTMITKPTLVVVEPSRGKAMRSKSTSTSSTSSSSSIDSLSTNRTSTIASKKRSTKRTKKAVHFGVVTISEHPIIVGCNPAVSSGVPLTIGWYSISQQTMSIDDFEVLREPDRVLFRTMLQQPSSERYAILQNLGFTRQELRQAEQEANVIRESRCQSYLDVDVDDDDNANTNTYKKEQYQLRLQKLYEVSQLRKQQQQQQQRHRYRRFLQIQKQHTGKLVTSSSSPTSPMLSTVMRRIMIFK